MLKKYICAKLFYFVHGLTKKQTYENLVLSIALIISGFAALAQVRTPPALLVLYLQLLSY